MIELRSVSKSFGAVKAVEEVSFATREGEIFGLLGPNGAGKSTTIKMIMNILAPDSGEILFNGRPLVEADKDRIGYLPEERGLYRKVKIDEMLLYLASLKNADRGAAEKSLDAWLERFELSEWKKRTPESLSKGMAQKVQFIAAVLHDPELIFLDEPFSGLDPVSTDVMREVVVELGERGKTIVFSTHTMDVAEKICSRILIIDHGREVISGSLDEIKTRLGRNSVVVEFDGALDMQALSGMVNDVIRYPRWVEMELADGTSPQTLLKTLVGQVAVRRFEAMAPSLHKIFVHLVGRKEANVPAMPVAPDWEAMISCLRREGTPRRVHCMELFLDDEVQQAICTRFGLEEGLDRSDPFFNEKRQIALQRFLGYDYVRCGLEGAEWTWHQTLVQDTASNRRAGGRSFTDEHRGPITTWEEFEKYPWPDFSKAGTRGLEWYQRNLPDGMCLVSGGNSHYAELLSWLMGYETLCYALYDTPDLVRAIALRIDELSARELEIYLQFDRVRCIWGSDDMGFRTGLLMAPADMRELVLAGHKRMAARAHAAGRLYLLHSCGNLAEIREDLISDVRIDAKHSFEDTIESVVDAKRSYGDRLSLLGGIDVDFLCRSSEKEIRARVRATLDACMPGGGYCLGTGNTVANYVPLDNYLAMLDEGRRYSA
jgi:ABC-type uncharacterized transport system ATPase subunit